MDEAAGVRVGQRMTHLPQEIDDALGRERTEFANERLEIATREQLHDVIERAVTCRAEIEQPNRMRGAERGGRPSLALEASQRKLHVRLVARSKHLRTHKLDGGRARQQPMFGAPHFTHASPPEQFGQPVAAHGPRLMEPPAESP